MLPSKRALYLAFLSPLVWAACGDETIAPLGASTTGGGGSGGTGGSTTSASSTGGAGGGTTSASTTGGSGGTGGTGGASSSSASSGGAGGTGGAPDGSRVRIAAANLTSGNLQSYDPGAGIRILQGLHADIVLLQEVNYGLDGIDDLRQLTDDICGQECTMARGAGQIPNAVISRYPVLDAGVWVDPQVQNRDFAWARLDIPGPIDLWAVSVHLLTSNASERDAEAAALIVAIDGIVPGSDFLVMGGDFNTHARDEPALTTLAAHFSVTAPYPTDGAGNEFTNTNRTKPYDWVLASPELRALEIPVLIGATHFDTGLVVDTRVYSPLTDLSPAEIGDSGSSNMQHMAVARDFLLPAEPVTSGGI
jgi:endonuclease/exonuclease/phosphatase family metal-dependent hydrolase